MLLDVGEGVLYVRGVPNDQRVYIRKEGPVVLLSASCERHWPHACIGVLRFANLSRP